MRDFSLSSPVSVSLATAMLLWSILTVAQIPNGATVRSSRLQRENIRVEKLTVDDGRPVAEAAAELEKRYGWVITYEDPIYVNDRQIADVTLQVRRDLDKYKPGEAPKVLVPKAGKLSISFNVQSDTGRPVNAAPAIVRQLLNSNDCAGYAGRFRLKMNGEIMHIIPTAYKSKSGALVRQQAVFDSVITIPSQDRTVLQSLELLCDAISRPTVVKVVLGTIPQNLFYHSRSRVGAKRETARDFLVRLLGTANTTVRLSWQLFYGPGMRFYALNIHAVGN